MKQLTADRIIQLDKRKGVDHGAVANFLFSMDGLTYEEAKANLALDAKSYGWNAKTVAAIRTGILERGVR